jgi:Uma2 family endonuclease
MNTDTNKHNMPYAPTDTADLYPDTDGQPMAASDLHLEILIRLLQVLRAYFSEMPEVYVSGDILTYYIEGNPRAVCAPDVLVTFGIGQKQRHTYKVWEEGKVPDFVMEFSSRTTYQNDLTDKMTLYARLGIPNYLLYDAEALYLPSPLMGFQLVKGVYVPIPPGVDGSIHSDILGLDFHIRERRLEVYDPVSEQWLQTPAETAEAEVARLQAELARLKERM